MAFESEAWKDLEVEREEELPLLELTSLLALPLEVDPQLEEAKAGEALTGVSGGPWGPAALS